MSKRMVNNEEAESDLLDALEEIGSGERCLWFVLITGCGLVGGREGAPGAYIMSRCLLEAETGFVFDAAGRFVPTARSGRDKATSEAREDRNRVRMALRAGRRAGAHFVCCSHIEGDPNWYLDWSDQHDCASAVDAVVQYLKGGMLWE